MPYSTGSQAADANCAKVFMETTLHSPLLAAGFTYVEEWISGVKVARIYKSPGASNFFGSDWYLIIYRATDTATSISVKVSEQYNTGTHKGIKYAPTPSTFTPASDFSVNDATGQLPDSASWFASVVNIATAGFQYWLSLHPDRAIIATRATGTDTALYVGLYDDLQSLTISPFPLFVTALIGQNDTGAATREPNQTTSQSKCFGLAGLGYSQTSPVTNNPEVYTGFYWLGRCYVHSAITTDRVRGFARDVWYGPSGSVNGDTLTATINGVSKTLVAMHGNSSTYRTYVDTSI